MPTLLENIEKIGVDKCKVQYLDFCMSNIKTNKKGVSNITFQSTHMTANDVVLVDSGTVSIQSEMVAAIIWIPRAELKACYD